MYYLYLVIYYILNILLGVKVGSESLNSCEGKSSVHESNLHDKELLCDDEGATQKYALKVFKYFNLHVLCSCSVSDAYRMCQFSFQYIDIYW